MKKITTTLLIIFLFSINIISQSTNYLILISFDGFRWDYVNRGITPNLDRMKKDGVSALSLRPSFPSKTFPNHLSIITGMYPEHHGILFNDFENPFTHEIYTIDDTISNRESKWYLGEAFWETAERQGIKTASYFWPGSELPETYRRPTYREYYEHERPYEKRVEGVIEWLKLPPNERPHFITLYFDDTDTYGHRFGPNSSQINESIKRLDNIIGLLYEKLSGINLIDSVNIIVVSDHGMNEMNPDRVINVSQILNGYECEIEGTGTVMMIKPPVNKVEEVYNLLKINENHYKAYTKDNIPAYFHFSEHPFISPIILIADLGWSLLEGNNKKYRRSGDHGYDNNQTDMHGIFIADGPCFKNGYYTGTLWNIDIYPLLCKIFDIIPRANIDGKLERIEFILNE